VSHELFAHELLGPGAELLNSTQSDVILQRFARGNPLPSKIRWIVFKVKKKAKRNYFEKIFERKDSFQDESISVSSVGIQKQFSYNWPYDFFSLVELVKLDASIEFANIDETRTVSQEKTVLKPYVINED